MAKDNHSPGRSIVRGVPSGPRGAPQVAVTFAVEGDMISLAPLDKKSNHALEVNRLLL